jgi:hypothetical protein
MGTVVVNVYKQDESYFKTPSLCEFVVEEKEGWQSVVEATLAHRFTPRSDYYLCFEYRKEALQLQELEACA